MTWQRGKVAVVGGGSWGCALAAVLAHKLSRLTLWCLEEEVAQGINRTHRNPHFLSDLALPENIHADTDLEAVTREHGLLVMVVPTQFTRAILARMQPHLTPETVFVSASKGIEVDSLHLISQLYEASLGPAVLPRLCSLSGPSFARETIQQLPTAVSIAGDDPQLIEEIQTLFHTPWFRTYATDDRVGVELGGAVKNVIALAAGISAGLGFGNNAKAALITRGLAEMTRLGAAMGARPETLYGLAGMGDLVLTANSELSRNFTTGLRLGQGETLEGILSSRREVAEGVKTVLAVKALAEQRSVDMPITMAVHGILYEGKEARQMVGELMSRSLKWETG